MTELGLSYEQVGRMTLPQLVNLWCAGKSPYRREFTSAADARAAAGLE